MVWRQHQGGPFPLCLRPRTLQWSQELPSQNKSSLTNNNVFRKKPCNVKSDMELTGVWLTVCVSLVWSPCPVSRIFRWDCVWWPFTPERSMALCLRSCVCVRALWTITLFKKYGLFWEADQRARLPSMNVTTYEIFSNLWWERGF